MPTRVFVTGGTGFVGAAVVAELTRRAHDVVALTRHKAIPGTRTVHADVFDRQALTDGMSGCAAAIHLIGIIDQRPSAGVTFQRLHVDATQAVLDVARSAGVRRHVHMSALGARPDAPSEYHRTKSRAEDLVRDSGLDWTIFRPSLIHGPRGEFMQMEAAWARGRRAPFLFMPYFGAGPLGRCAATKLQPVHVADVAHAFADALELPATINRSYDLGGSRQMTWPEMHHIASRVIAGRQRPAVPIPAWYAKLLTRLLPRTLLPFNRDQVLMSQEDNTCDLTQFQRDFGWQPADFETTLNTYAAQL